MTATLNVQLTGSQAAGRNFSQQEAVRTVVNTAFAEWLRHFDYTTGNYDITLVFSSSVPDVALSGDAYVRVGTSNGTGAFSTATGTGGRPIVATLFGLDVAARNGVSPPTSPLTLTVNTAYYASGADLIGPLEREFEHALGVRSSRGTAPPQPVPAGTQSVYDYSVIGVERGAQMRPPTLPLFFAGQNTLLAYPASGGSSLLPLSDEDGSTTLTGSGLTVNTSVKGGAASRQGDRVNGLWVFG